jgi:hypothetical protein
LRRGRGALSNGGFLGSIIATGLPGWGAGTFTSILHNADVRVLAWSSLPKPDYESPWVTMTSNAPSAFTEIVHNLGE